MLSLSKADILEVGGKQERKLTPYHYKVRVSRISRDFSQHTATHGRILGGGGRTLSKFRGVSKNALLVQSFIVSGSPSSA